MPEPSNTARIAHNLGLATWFGGALFGQIALNPTISRISDRRERGRVLNESWGRFNAVVFATIAVTVLTWRLEGLKGDAELRAPALARVKNLLLGGAVINGVASGVMGPGSRKRPPRVGRKMEPQSRWVRSLRRRPPRGPPRLSA